MFFIRGIFMQPDHVQVNKKGSDLLHAMGLTQIYIFASLYELKIT